MADPNRLSIISVSSLSPQHSSIPSRLTRKKELQAKFERLWLLNPEHFNPLRNCMQRERLERSWSLLTQQMSLADKKVVDLGCGSGLFSQRLIAAGAFVDGVDIAENALKKLKEQSIERLQLIQDALPDTSLKDDTYHLAVCLEVIAELPREDHRLFFAELYRLIKPDGKILCSSSIDIYSEDALQRLMELAQTEFEIAQVVYSYHALSIRLKHLCQIPQEFVKGWEEPTYRKQALASRSFLSRIWFWLNSSTLLMWIWWSLTFLTRPLLSLLAQNRTLLLGLEKICRALWDERGISHVIFMAKRKPIMPQMPEEQPRERPRKKEIWE
jgi:2-polyprenyl-3-methyl-5-hydroxy-6-metoxy-1,4-benzoquinol methylase